MSDDIIKISQKRRASPSSRDIIYKYLRFWPWVVISVLGMLTLAYIKLRYSTPIYSVSGKLLVKKEKEFGGGNEKFEQIFMMQGASNSIGDEIEIIKSRTMATRVINSLSLYKQIYNKGNIRTSVIHATDAPFVFDIKTIKDTTNTFSITVTVIGNNQFKLNEDTGLYYFNQIINLPQVQFRLTKTSNPLNVFASNIFIVTWKPIELIADELSQGISLKQIGDYSSVLGLSYETPNPKIGLSIVNQFMEEYMKASREDKIQQAVNTLAFIDDQLDTVKYELGTVEKSLQNYREKNRVFNTEQQSELFSQEISSSEKELTEQGVRIKIIDYLISYIKDTRNPYRKVSTSLGIEEPSLLQQIGEFNKLQQEREINLTTTSNLNPLIQGYESSIEKLRLDILENLNNIRKAYFVAQSDLLKKKTEIDLALISIPKKEKQLLEVRREQSILQELYSFLLQKKLETSISSASTISSIKVLDRARSSGMPISPNKKSLYLIALLLGIALPVGIALLKEYLNDKIKSKSEIEQMTNTPVVGEIGHSDNDNALVVTQNNRSFISEQFRIIRSNLTFILSKIKKPVIMITSSFSGEGKSFLSTNLGAVLALSGKRVVILEFDIRKPKIIQGLGLQAKIGITNYIVGSANLDSIIIPVPQIENLFVVPCGPIPPNPAEMLLDEKVALLFQSLKESFDVVIVDTAPIGLVSDAITIGGFADMSIFVTRHNYTYKKQIQLIDELYTGKKLSNLSIIINDVDLKSSYSSGYSYGYGYGYGLINKDDIYFDNTMTGKKKKGLFKRWS